MQTRFRHDLMHTKYIIMVQLNKILKAFHRTLDQLEQLIEKNHRTATCMVSRLMPCCSFKESCCPRPRRSAP